MVGYRCVAGIREKRSEVEPRFNDFLGITNDFPGPSNSKVYGKEPRYNGTSISRILVEFY